MVCVLIWMMVMCEVDDVCVVLMMWSVLVICFVLWLCVVLFDLDGMMVDSDLMYFVVFDEFLWCMGVLRVLLMYEYFKENIVGGLNVDIFVRLYLDKSVEEYEVMVEVKEVSFREALAREAL